jgi:hypothetical protein
MIRAVMFPGWFLLMGCVSAAIFHKDQTASMVDGGLGAIL